MKNGIRTKKIQNVIQHNHLRYSEKKGGRGEGRQLQRGVGIGKGMVRRKGGETLPNIKLLKLKLNFTHRMGEREGEREKGSNLTGCDFFT
jgi:hypothetical protein